jgi:hypothetical protein
MPSDWPRNSTRGRGTTTCRMTRGGGSEDEHPDGAHTRRHHPKFDSRRNTVQNRLRHRPRSIHEEFDQVEYQGEQVYRTLAHYALSSRMLVDQIIPHLPKDNEEVNAHVKRLQAMFDTATVIPRSEKEGTKPPYVYPGCSNHTHGNNMINRCNVIKITSNSLT